MAEKKKRRRGRPPVPPAERKRNNVTIRLRDRTKSQLEERAAANQRSLSEEAEARLEYSFKEAEIWGGPAVLNLARLTAAALAQAGERAATRKQLRPEDWVNDSDCYLVALKHAIKVLSDAAPSAMHKDFAHIKDEEKRRKAKKISTGVRRAAAWRHVRDAEGDEGENR